MLLACSKNMITTWPRKFRPTSKKRVWYYVLRIQIGPYIASCITSSNVHKLCREGNVSCMQHGTISFNRRFLAIKKLPSPTHTHFIHKRSQILFISFISDFIWEPWLIVDCFRGFHMICRIRKLGGKLAVKVRKGGKYLRVWNISGGGQS